MDRISQLIDKLEKNIDDVVNSDKQNLNDVVSPVSSDTDGIIDELFKNTPAKTVKSRRNAEGTIKYTRRVYDLKTGHPILEHHQIIHKNSNDIKKSAKERRVTGSRWENISRIICDVQCIEQQTTINAIDRMKKLANNAIKIINQANQLELAIQKSGLNETVI